MNHYFQRLNDHVYKSQQEIGATAAAIYIIKSDRVIHEWYSGKHDSSDHSRSVDAHTQFNVGSVRKTYLALAISILIEQGKIASIDNEIGYYLHEYRDIADGVTLRHLLTHSHGLVEENGTFVREFPAGKGWSYRNPGITMLIQLVRHLSGQTLSEFMDKEVFSIVGLRETGWRTAVHEYLIYNYYKDMDTWVGPNDSPAGDQSNLFVSARDLASWGYLHLRKGYINNKQILPRSIFKRVTSHHTPITVPIDQPQHGFIWWLQSDTVLNEIGESLPSNTYQVLGITGCVCLVIPQYDAVVVRMYNQLGNPNGYDYLKDLREFGDITNELLNNYSINNIG